MIDPIVPEVCDRLNCKLDSCYGWDLCRQAREEATDKEWEKLWAELFPCIGAEEDIKKVRSLPHPKQ